MKFFADLYKNQHLGLLCLRIGIGIAFIIHGYPKITGGPELWSKLGGAMANWGINFAPIFWGFMGAISEFGGGLLLILGLFFRPVTILLFLTMVVATFSHISNHDSFNTYSHALELGIVFLSCALIGPGRYSLDAKFGKANHLPSN